jgi:Transposase IS66 family
MQRHRDGLRSPLAGSTFQGWQPAQTVRTSMPMPTPDTRRSTDRSRVGPGLRRIQELFAIEAEINGGTAERRLAEWQARTVRLLAALRTWYEDQRRRLSTVKILARTTGLRSQSIP